MAYGTRHIVEAMAARGQVISVATICGGLAKSSLFVQGGPTGLSNTNVNSVNTGLPANSDSVETANKCRCKRGASSCVNCIQTFLLYKGTIGRSEKCHCKRGASIYVTVSGGGSPVP